MARSPYITDAVSRDSPVVIDDRADLTYQAGAPAELGGMAEGLQPLAAQSMRTRPGRAEPEKSALIVPADGADDPATLVRTGAIVTFTDPRWPIASVAQRSGRRRGA